MELEFNKIIFSVLFFISITTFGQHHQIKGWFKTMHTDITGGGGSPPPPIPPYYKIAEASSTFADTAIDGVSSVVQGDTFSLYGGWNASFGLPYTRHSVYMCSVNDFSHVTKVYAEWTARHSIGYGVGGTGYAYAIGGDLQPEVTSTSRKEVWRTTTNTSSRHWTLQTNTPGWNDSLVLCGFALKPNTSDGNDTLYYGGGQKSYDGIRNGKIYRSTNAGSTWTEVADDSLHYGGNFSGNLCWYPTLRKFIFLKAGVYYNNDALRVYSDSIFATNDFTTVEFVGKIPEKLHYPQLRFWDNKIWLVDGFSQNINGNTDRIYNINQSLIISEMVIRTPTPLHATSLAVDLINDRLIIGCGNLVRNVWYIYKSFTQ